MNKFNLDFVYVLNLELRRWESNFVFSFRMLDEGFFAVLLILSICKKLLPDDRVGRLATDEIDTYLERTFMNFNFFSSRFISFYFDSEASAA